MSQHVEPAMPFQPALSIEYSAQSVVSKTILKKPSGNVTLFAFDKDEGLSEHSSPHDALVQILDGAADVRIGETSHQLSSDQSIILPANIPHALYATDRFKMMLIMIRE